MAADQKKSKVTFDIVPNDNYEDWDVDDLAETLVIARKMLRKKDRINILNHNYFLSYYNISY